MLFARKLRQLRDAAGLSEAKLAQACGLKLSLIHEYGLGRRRNPSFGTVVKIARALDVPLEEFAQCQDFVSDLPLPATKTSRSRSPKATPAAGAAARKPKGRRKEN
jgi:transcriptional regulator with XRE-family HTH domain